MDPRPVEGPVKKDDREIMNVLEAFDLTGSAHSAARLPAVIRRRSVIGSRRVTGVCRWAAGAGGSG